MVRPKSIAQDNPHKRYEEYQERVHEHELDHIFHEQYATMGWESPPDRDHIGFGSEDRGQKKPSTVKAEYEFKRKLADKQKVTAQKTNDNKK
jgi:hypothetical protein